MGGNKKVKGTNVKLALFTALISGLTAARAVGDFSYQSIGVGLSVFSALVAIIAATNPWD